jgi:hypothetical protein
VLQIGKAAQPRRIRTTFKQQPRHFLIGSPLDQLDLKPRALAQGGLSRVITSASLSRKIWVRPSRIGAKARMVAGIAKASPAAAPIKDMKPRLSMPAPSWLNHRKHPPFNATGLPPLRPLYIVIRR